MKAKLYRLWRIDNKFTKRKRKKKNQKERMQHKRSKRVNKGLAKEIAFLYIKNIKSFLTAI